jgi:hypothetical protein
VLKTTLQLRYRWVSAFFQIAVNRVFLLGLVSMTLTLTPNAWTAEIHEAEDKTFIVDQKGERWEITQAVSLGFRPQGFQFGIGRDAIRPLDGENLKTDGDNLPEATRVIGVAEEGGRNAHAYSIGRLTRHEIANTQLGDAPIAAAY